MVYVMCNHPERGIPYIHITMYVQLRVRYYVHEEHEGSLPNSTWLCFVLLRNKRILSHVGKVCKVYTTIYSP